LPIFSHAPGYLQPQVRSEQTVLDDLAFLGFNFVGSELEAGSPILVDLYWRSDHASGSHPSAAALPVKLSLVNDDTALPLWEGELAPMSDWDPGEELCRRIRTRLPVDMPPGSYALHVQLPEPDWSSDLLEINARASTRIFEPPPLEVASSALFSDASGADGLRPAGGDQIRLLGLVTYALDSAAAPASLDLTLTWEAVSSPRVSYKVFVHLLDENGVIVAQSDATPGSAGADYPTNRWLAGEFVLDQHQLELPNGLEPGLYTIVAGLYDPISAVRLSAVDGQGQPLPDGRATLQEISIP